MSSQASTPTAPTPGPAHSAAAHLAAPRTCVHLPLCPAADAPDHEAAVPVATHPEQGWSLLCNGVVLFEDTGELLPDGRVVAPRRVTDRVPAPTVPVAVRA